MENESGKSERADGAEELERLREGHADLVDSDVIQDVGKRDADHGGKDEDQVHLGCDVKRSADFSKGEREGKQQRRSNEANYSETADGAELGGRAFDENTIKRPAKDRDEGDDKALPGNMSILAIRLKPDDTECAEQSEQRSELELPLANDVAFLGKKGEGKQCGENHGCAGNDSVDTGSHVKERDGLGYLVDDVRYTGNQAEPDGANIDLSRLRGTAKLKQNERDNCETGDAVAVKILRPGIVETVEIKLKKRGQRPDGHGREDRGVSSGELTRASLHPVDCAMAPLFRSLICWLARA